MNKLFGVIDKKIEQTLMPFKDIITKGLDWANKQKFKRVSIKSFDGLKLNGSFLKNKKEKYIIVLCHGYRSNPVRDLYSGLSEYYKMGCSILLLESRACASSEGKYITFGYKESKDINSWVNYIHRLNKNTPIIVGGISLGASSLLMTNNKHIKLMFCDCPFDSAYNEVKYVIKHYFHLPAVIFMPMISLYFRLFAGTSLKRLDVYSNLDKLNIPILLFHGVEDEFIPCKNSMSIYNYYEHDIELVLFEGADHGLSFLVDKKRYINKIKEYIKKYMV